MLLFPVPRHPNAHVLLASQPAITKSYLKSTRNHTTKHASRLLHEICHVNEAVTLEMGRWNAALRRFSWNPSTRSEN
ncbi:hypothetical protein Peur_054200 [Populus x canadensis]